MTIGNGPATPGIHVVPSSLTNVVGVLTGNVTDVQNWQDGNTLDVEEVANTPGQNVEFHFENVRSIRRVGVALFYRGSTTHWLEVQIYDYTAATWRVLLTFATALGLNYRYTDLPVSYLDFINGSNQAKLRIYHPENGNAAHHTTIDYMALIS